MRGFYLRPRQLATPRFTRQADSEAMLNSHAETSSVPAARATRIRTYCGCQFAARSIHSPQHRPPWTAAVDSRHPGQAIARADGASANGVAGRVGQQAAAAQQLRLAVSGSPCATCEAGARGLHGGGRAVTAEDCRRSAQPRPRSSVTRSSDLRTSKRTWMARLQAPSAVLLQRGRDAVHAHFEETVCRARAASGVVASRRSRPAPASTSASWLLDVEGGEGLGMEGRTADPSPGRQARAAGR